MIRRFKTSTKMKSIYLITTPDYRWLRPRSSRASAGRMGCPNLGLDSINSSIVELNSVALAYWKSQ